MGTRLYSMGWPNGDRGEHKPDPYIFHFPDGNASIARLLVRSFIPGAMPGTPWKTWSWPRPTTAVSTAIPPRAYPPEQHCRWSAARRRPNSASEVVVTYARNRHSFRCADAVACWLATTAWSPTLPQLPRRRKKRWLMGKDSLVYSHIALRNWLPFQKLGVHQIAARDAITRTQRSIFQ